MLLRIYAGYSDTHVDVLVMTEFFIVFVCIRTLLCDPF